MTTFRMEEEEQVLTSQELEDFQVCINIKDFSYSLIDQLNTQGLLITKIGNEKIINRINFKYSPIPPLEFPIGQITEIIYQGPRTKTNSAELYQLLDPNEYERLRFENVEIEVNEPNNTFTTTTRDFDLYCNSNGKCTCKGRQRKRIDLDDPRFRFLKLKTIQGVQEGGGI